jgi:hypothetical protein
MKISFSYAMAALVCGTMFSSCVPYDEYGRRIYPPKQPGQKSNVTDPKQQEIEAKREEMRKKEELRKKELGITEDTIKETPDGTTGGTGTTEMPKPTTPPKNHPVAAAVPGKPGFVFSPFNNKVVDVRGIASDTLVADPQYPAADKKHFRVP